MTLPVIHLRRRREMRRWALPVLAGIVALLAFAGTGLGTSYTIQAINYKFVVPGDGSSLTVGVGAQVTWVASGEGHSVTSGRRGAPDNRFADHPASAGALNPGDTFTTTFTAPGTYPYFCEFHSEQMMGVVTVVATATNPPAPTKAATPRPTAIPTAPPTAPPTAVTTQAPPSPSRGVETVPPPSVTPSPTTGAGAVPTAGSSTSASDGGFGVVGDGTGSSGATTTAVVVVLGGLALAGLVAFALRRRNRSA